MIDRRPGQDRYQRQYDITITSIPFCRETTSQNGLMPWALLLDVNKSLLLLPGRFDGADVHAAQIETLLAVTCMSVPVVT